MMARRTDVTMAQWQDAFDQWDTGGWTIKRLARSLHVDEPRVMRTFEEMDTQRFARVKQEHATHGPKASHIKRRPRTTVAPAQTLPKKAAPVWKMTHLPEVKRPKPKTRACLKCDRTFQSTDDDNRLCDSCRNQLFNGPSPERVYRVGVA